MLPNAPHPYLGSTRDRYCNWQFMACLKAKHGAEAVTQIWTTPGAEFRSGTARHANGAGCSPSGTPSTVYVGPYTTIQPGGWGQ
ncbi:MAG TPA: hypothetical protein VF670_04685 [Duganella sp.]|jgi:hypothetical protein